MNTIETTYNEYKKGKHSHDKRLHSKAAKRASKMMRAYRKGKSTRYSELMEAQTMSDQVIASKGLTKRKSGYTPFVEFREDRQSDDEIEMVLSSNGFQSNCYGLTVEMFDALKELMNNHKVVEYVETLRDKG